MHKTFSNLLLLPILVGIFLVVVLVNNVFLRGIYLDLTDDNIYSLSTSSERLTKNLSQTIELKFFYSETHSGGMTGIRDYAKRVESLLLEYERISRSRINLEIIDPVPFSEDEDQAASYGLRAVATGMTDETIYFGMVATNNLGNTKIIEFFDPQKEAFLEYEITDLLYKLNDPKPKNLTIITDLPIAGGRNTFTGRSTPAYVLYEQLASAFELTLLSASSDTLPDKTDVLMVWHPQNMSENLLKSVDQFLMKGGKGLFLLDPHYESDALAKRGRSGANMSNLRLLDAYGIRFYNDKVVLDALIGLEVRNQNGGTERHLGYLGLGQSEINRTDITTGNINAINGASFGVLALAKNSLLSQESLLTSSRSSGLMSNDRYADTTNRGMLRQGFVRTKSEYVLGARYTGPATSYFAPKNAAQTTNDVVTQTENLNIVVIADADIGADRFWVQKSDLYGQTITTPFANNSDFILNILENYSGEEGLIGVRSRGTFARPFTRVQGIQAVAEEKFREQETRLQEQLAQTESQLMKLQAQSDSVSLGADQETAIAQFTQQRIKIRKSLREVQFELNKDINHLGNALKILNVLVMPLVLVLLLYVFARIFRSKPPRYNYLDN